MLPNLSCVFLALWCQYYRQIPKLVVLLSGWLCPMFDSRKRLCYSETYRCYPQIFTSKSLNSILNQVRIIFFRMCFLVSRSCRVLYTKRLVQYRCYSSKVY